MPVTLTFRFDPFLTLATFIPAAAVPVTFISNKAIERFVGTDGGCVHQQRTVLNADVRKSEASHAKRSRSHHRRI